MFRMLDTNIYYLLCKVQDLLQAWLKYSVMLVSNRCRTDKHGAFSPLSFKTNLHLQQYFIFSFILYALDLHSYVGFVSCFVMLKQTTWLRGPQWVSVWWKVIINMLLLFSKLQIGFGVIYKRRYLAITCLLVLTKLAGLLIFHIICAFRSRSHPLRFLFFLSLYCRALGLKAVWMHRITNTSTTRNTRAGQAWARRGTGGNIRGVSLQKARGDLAGRRRVRSPKMIRRAPSFQLYIHIRASNLRRLERDLVVWVPSLCF